MNSRLFSREKIQMHPLPFTQGDGLEDWQASSQGSPQCKISIPTYDRLG